MTPTKPATSLVATLGNQPQVVTFLLDLLLARGYPISQVYVVCLAGGERFQQVYKRLAAEFAGGRYNGRPCALTFKPIRLGEDDLAELTDPVELQAVQNTFHDLLSDLKQGHQSVHLGLSGGFRTMALIALSAAMLYLKPTDRLWHIYTPAELEAQSRDGAIMHAPAEAGVCLVEVPFVPWAAYYPGLKQLLDQPSADPETTVLGWLSPEDHERCEQVWKQLTPRQQEVLRCYAKGMSRGKIAGSLCISDRTVDTYRIQILDICNEVWSPEAGQKLDNRFLERKFGVFLRTQLG